VSTAEAELLPPTGGQSIDRRLDTTAMASTSATVQSRPPPPGGPPRSRGGHVGSYTDSRTLTQTAGDPGSGQREPRRRHAPRRTARDTTTVPPPRSHRPAHGNTACTARALSFRRRGQRSASARLTDKPATGTYTRGPVTASRQNAWPVAGQPPYRPARRAASALLTPGPGRAHRRRRSGLVPDTIVADGTSTTTRDRHRHGTRNGNGAPGPRAVRG